MLSYGKKIRASRDKNNKYSNSRVVRKKILNEKKTHSPPRKYSEMRNASKPIVL